MAIIAKINTTTNIGRAKVSSPVKTSIVSSDFSPKPNVAVSELADVEAVVVQNGQTLVFNSVTGKYEANTVSVPVVNGGTF